MLRLQRHALTFDAPRERQHLSHHTCATLGIRSHDFEPLLAVLVSDSQLQHVDRHQDRRKNVVQVVSDAAGKGADRLHSLSSQKLRLHPFLFGDVGVDDQD
jgi:hypothetical protein